MTAPTAAARTVRYRDASRRDRRLFRAVLAFVSVLVLAGLLVVGDIAARSFAEGRVSQEIGNRLPVGVDGGVDTRIGGFSFLLQYLSGRFEDVDIVSQDLTIAGVPVEAAVALEGVPVDQSRPVEHGEGSLVLDQDSVSALLAAQGVEGSVTLDDDSLEYTATTAVLGQDLDLVIDTRAEAQGGRIVFTPQQSRVSLGELSVDAQPLLDRLAPQGLAVCVAQFLPAAITLESVRVEDGRAVARLEATDLLLGGDLSTTGTCA